MAFVRDIIKVCESCLIAIANDDYSGMDDKEESRVRAGIERTSQRGHLCAGSVEYGFYNTVCECCGALAGNRHEVFIMWRDEDKE